jgi:RimJ/RimL family protein N-acetyltransferase
VQWPNDAADVVEFLVANEWPFHGITRLTREQAASVSISGDDVLSFWVRADGATVGLLRAFDLSDLAVGSPLLDIRIAEGARGLGVGTASVRWLTSHVWVSADGSRSDTLIYAILRREWQHAAHR